MAIKTTSRRQFLKALGIGAVAAFLPGAAGQARAQGAKPLNIVLILIDDLGWADLGCYGSSLYETPNIDRLAAEGIRFADHYAASPVCSPTRASIVTGQYPARVGITDWIPGQNPGGKRLLNVSDLHNLPLEEETFAEAFKTAGYTTKFIGKWHLGETEPFWPEAHGFDSNTGGCNWGQPKGGDRYFSPWNFPAGANLLNATEGDYLPERLAREAEDFMTANQGNPFLLYHCHYTVHTPLHDPSAALVQKYTDKLAANPPAGPTYLPEHDRENREVQSHARYAAMIEAMDTNVGRVLQKIKDLNIEDSTAVIFTSDNGGLSVHRGPTSNRPLRAGKGWHYEGGVRVPLIIKWPGVTVAGEVCDEPTISMDFYPTMLEMAGRPLNPAQHADGLSLAPLLRGDAAQLNRDALYFHFPHYHGSGHRPSGAVRARDWKLIEYFETMLVELYNLKDDPGETTDLSKKRPDKVAELRKNLHGWRRDIGAKMPDLDLTHPDNANPRAVIAPGRG